MTQYKRKATFAAGCFWGVEYRFREINGVLDTCVGYCGGHTHAPNYKQVCSGKTGHAEAIEVEFDENIISYAELLNHFWAMHDPTTPNRQGADIGTQYRSVIFYHDETQRHIAIQSKEKCEQSGRYSSSIVTEIVPVQTFYPAEEYHQRYLEKNGLTSCH